MCGQPAQRQDPSEPIGVWRQVGSHLGLGTYQRCPGHPVKDTFRTLMKIQQLELLLPKKKKRKTPFYIHEIMANMQNICREWEEIPPRNGV